MAQVKKYSELADLAEMVEIRSIKQTVHILRDSPGDLTELMESIHKNGLLQPIIVRPNDSKFEVIAGNRRLEACRKLHWSSIPCIIKELDDKEAYELSILENVQRQNLSFLEEARAYQRYTKEFGWGSAHDLAIKIGKSEPYISHVISILKLPNRVLEKIESAQISRSLAQELMWLKDESLQIRMADLALHHKTTIRELRTIVRASNGSRITEPFSSEWVRHGPTHQQMLLDRAALSLRVAMIRLDSLVERADDDHIRSFLMQKRFAVHELIDEILTRKKTVQD